MHMSIVIYWTAESNGYNIMITKDKTLKKTKISDDA